MSDQKSGVDFLDVGPKVGSRLSAWLGQMSGQKSGVDFGLGCSGGLTWCQSWYGLRSASQEGGLGGLWKVFPVLLYYPELSPTRRAQYENCGSDWQCARPFIPFWQEDVGVAKSA